MSAGSSSASKLDFDLHIMSQRLKKCITDSMDTSFGLAENIAEYCDEDEALKERTKKLMCSFVEMETEIEQYAEAIQALMKEAPHSSSSEEADTSNTDLVKEFEAKLRDVSRANRTGPEDHPGYRKLETALASTHNLEEQLNTLRDTLLGDTQDDDIAVTQAEVNLRCPYTGQRMTDPVRNTICGHVYEKEGILGHIKAKKGRAKCPVGGCGNPQPIKESHLEDHTDMKRYITLLARLNR